MSPSPEPPLVTAPHPEPITVARVDGTHQLDRSRWCNHTLQDTCEQLTPVSGVETVWCPKSGAENSVTVSMCSVSWDVPLHPLYTPLCPLQTTYSWHTSSLSKPCLKHPHSRKQGLLFEDRFGDPFLASRFFFPLVLYLVKNTHEHHHILLCVFRIISFSE